ncbi:MAG: PD-(D/E)XK nuclease family protein, partial [Bacteroidales bacterium]
FHKTMQILYTPYVNKELTSTDFFTLKNKTVITQAVVQAFNTLYNSNVSEIKGYDSVIEAVIQKYVWRCLGIDQIYAPFTIQNLEYRVNYTYKYNKSKEVNIGGIIDRIDSKNGSMRMVDYKTGRVSYDINGIDELFDRENKKRNDKVLQILLYAWIIAKNTNNHAIHTAFISFIDNAENNTFVKFKDTGELLVCTPQIQNIIENNLSQLFTELFDENIPFEQTKNTVICKFCDYNKICKKDVF